MVMHHSFSFVCLHAVHVQKVGLNATLCLPHEAPISPSVTPLALALAQLTSNETHCHCPATPTGGSHSVTNQANTPHGNHITRLSPPPQFFLCTDAIVDMGGLHAKLKAVCMVCMRIACQAESCVHGV